MANLSNMFILLHLKCTVDIFTVGSLGQMYHKHWKFLQNCNTEIIFIKPVLFFKAETFFFFLNQVRSKALNLFQDVKQAENSKWSLWNYCTI